MKEIGSGMGSESRLERSKGESRQDNIHLEAGNSHISNNNEGERDFKTGSVPVEPVFEVIRLHVFQKMRRRKAAKAKPSICLVMQS